MATNQIQKFSDQEVIRFNKVIRTDVGVPNTNLFKPNSLNIITVGHRSNVPVGKTVINSLLVFTDSSFRQIMIPNEPQGIDTVNKEDYCVKALLHGMNAMNRIGLSNVKEVNIYSNSEKVVTYLFNAFKFINNHRGERWLPNKIKNLDIGVDYKTIVTTDLCFDTKIMRILFLDACTNDESKMRNSFRDINEGLEMTIWDSIYLRCCDSFIRMQVKSLNQNTTREDWGYKVSAPKQLIMEAE